MGRLKNRKYDSGVNIMGGIPDYDAMLDYISDTYGVTENSYGSFSFRTEKALKRFIAVIETSVLKFNNEEHKTLFFKAIANEGLSSAERMIVLFWQLTYSNKLFGRITEEVFMKSLYGGRLTLTADEILSFLRYIKETEPEELGWSEETLKITASKYLTILKKLGLATGTQKKTIVHPIITSNLFVYFIRFVQAVYPGDKTLHNPYMIYAFNDEDGLINRLKKIENIPYWNITQVGNDITIELK